MGINFPASPTVGQKYPQPAVAGIPVYTWDGEKWTTVGGSIAAYAPPADAVPLVDATPGLVGTATEYAREDHVHPTDTSRASVTYVDSVAYGSMAYSGMQINGGMEVSQELGATPKVSGGYFVDGWKHNYSSGVIGIGQVVSALPGFPYCAATNVSTPVPSLAAGDYYVVWQSIEGYRIARLAWGTANAQPITVSFWTAHHRVGTYSGSVRNGTPPQPNRSYAFTYTQAVADSWQYNTVTIPGDTAGTWAKDNTIGLSLTFSAGVGTTFIAPSVNTWLAGNYNAAPGQINAIATTSDSFLLTGVTVLPGTQAPTAAQSPLIMRPYDQELATCKRYWEAVTGGYRTTLSVSGLYATWVDFKVEKRSVPSITTATGAVVTNTTAPILLDNNTMGAVVQFADGGSAESINYTFAVYANARL